jgi:hypothetical protein
MSADIALCRAVTAAPSKAKTAATALFNDHLGTLLWFCLTRPSPNLSLPTKMQTVMVTPDEHNMRVDRFL